MKKKCACLERHQHIIDLYIYINLFYVDILTCIDCVCFSDLFAACFSGSGASSVTISPAMAQPLGVLKRLVCMGDNI